MLLTLLRLALLDFSKSAAVVCPRVAQGKGPSLPCWACQVRKVDSHLVENDAIEREKGRIVPCCQYPDGDEVIFGISILIDKKTRLLGGPPYLMDISC